MKNRSKVDPMRRLIYGFSMVTALAIAAPAVAGDLTSIELDANGMIVAVKMEPGEFSSVPDIDGRPNEGFDLAAIYQVPPDSIDISKGINVMRGHVDANGSIAVHQGAESVYVLYVISGAGKMTLNDSEGKQVGEVAYKPDDVLVFHPQTWHGWINGDEPFEFLGFDMTEKK